MARFVALLTSFALLGSTTAMAAPGDAVKADPIASLKIFITSQYASDAESKVMAKNLVAQYSAQTSDSRGVIDSANETISSVDLKQASLTPQVRSLVKDLDMSLGSQVAQNGYMQQNLANLLNEMRTTLETNSRMRQDAVHQIRFGAVYWIAITGALFLGGYVGKVIENSGHGIYGVVAMATVLLGTGVIMAFGVGKLWKNPSARNPVPELADWQNELIQTIDSSKTKYCGAALSL